MSNESLRNTLILKLLFSGFSYPQESRFVKIFFSQATKKTQIINIIKPKKQSLNIESINVVNGKDKRTTIIIKNLPNDISKEEIKSIIEPLGNINFIYIPLLIKNKNKHKNILPCAYINVINYKTIIKIVQKFEQLKILNQFQNIKDFSKIEIFYSGTQGKNALISRFSLEKKYLPPNQQLSFS